MPTNWLPCFTHKNTWYIVSHDITWSQAASFRSVIISIERAKKENNQSFIFLGFHFRVTLESDMNNNGQQTRGIIKVKFNGQEDDALLFEYESIYMHVQIHPFVLFSQSTLLKRGSINLKTILITNKPATLENINISFKKSLGLNFGIGLADQWNFRSVTMLDTQSNLRLVIH
jgi:hypothetical protein